MKKLTDIFGQGSFIEEEFSYCSEPLKCTFYNEAQPIEESVTPNMPKSVKGIIGVAEGVFALLDGVSRNNRFYPHQFWPSVLNEEVMARVAGRHMQGTIGHFDKKVDTQDWADEKVSHVVTNLRIDEENKVVIGTFEILDTAAGRTLKTLYDAQIPVYVSSRGAGKLKRTMECNLDVVDENNYYIECWDIVKDPGFLQAKPNLIESFEETFKSDEKEKLNSIVEEKIEDKITEINSEELKLETQVNIEETNMTKELENKEDLQEDVTQITPEKTTEEIIAELLKPLQESVISMQEKVDSVKEEISKVKAEQSVVQEDKTDIQEEKTDVEKLQEENSNLQTKIDEQVQQIEKLSKEIENLKEGFTNSEKTLDESVEKVLSFKEDFEKLVKEKISLQEEMDKEKEEHEKTKKEKEEKEEKLEEALKELSARKLSEEVGITIEEAEQKLSEKTYEEVVQECNALKDEKEKKEAEEKQKKEKIEESLKTSYKATSKFINENKIEEKTEDDEISEEVSQVSTYKSRSRFI